MRENECCENQMFAKKFFVREIKSFQRSRFLGRIFRNRGEAGKEVIPFLKQGNKNYLEKHSENLFLTNHKSKTAYFGWLNSPPRYLSYCIHFLKYFFNCKCIKIKLEEIKLRRYNFGKLISTKRHYW